MLYSKLWGYCTLSADEVVLERAVQEVELYTELISDRFSSDNSVSYDDESHIWYTALYDKLMQKFDISVCEEIIAHMEKKLSTIDPDKKERWEKYYALSLRSMLHISRSLHWNAWIKEVLSWTKKDLSSILDGSRESEGNPEVWATCIDYMYTLKFLAEKIWISWKVKWQIYLPQVWHRYFLTDDGVVIDPMRARVVWWVLSYDEYKKRYPQWIPAPCQKNRK